MLIKFLRMRSFRSFLQASSNEARKINGVTSSFPLRVPLTYQLNTQNFDYNELFSIDEVDWAPLFPKTNNINSEQSIEIFKDNINSYIKRYLKHPKNSNNANDQVIVFVEMIVENDGSVSQRLLLLVLIFTENKLKK